MNEKQSPIYTIGYGTREIAPFITILKDNHIAFLIDVRSKPYSSYKPDFSKKALTAHMEEQGIRYVFMGDKLGGQPDDPDCYDQEGKVEYSKFLNKPYYLEGIKRIEKAWQQKLNIIIMCSEGKPEMCHRSKLIGRTLKNMGINIAHIDENDQIISQDDVELRLNKGQPSLFGDDFFNLTSRKRYLEDDTRT